VLPGSGDVVVFDVTSTKNAIIDPAFAGSIQGIQINAGYSGTITQAQNSGATLTIGGSGFSQASGTFVCDALENLDDNGTLVISAGTFNAAGTTSFASDFTISGGTFNAGTGTVVFDGGASTVDVATTQNFNNLTFNTPGAYKVIGSGDVLVVNGTLTLTDGQVINGTVNALGNVVLASTFDGGGTTLLISGNAVRTFTLPAGAGVPVLTVNAPNVTVNTSGSGSITFQQPVTWQSTAGVTNGAVNCTFNSVVTVNTNVTQGSGDLVYNNSYTQSGGTFTPSAGVLAYNSAFTLSGGVFNAPSGVVSFGSEFTISGGTFNAGPGQ
jgi:hypothetical protein